VGETPSPEEASSQPLMGFPGGKGGWRGLLRLLRRTGGVANALGRVHASGAVVAGRGRRFRRGNASGIVGHDPGLTGGILGSLGLR
jgi:hypothetical protein